MLARCNNGNGRENGEKSEKLFSLDVLFTALQDNHFPQVEE